MEKAKNIPELRFPEFEEEWKTKNIEDCFDFKNGLNKEKEFFGYGTPIINFKDVYNLTSICSKQVNGLVNLSKKEIENYSALKGDVFFTRTSETINDIGMSATLVEDIPDCVFSGFVLRARPKAKYLLPLFTSYCFNIEKIRKEIVTKSSFTTRALTSGTLLNKVVFSYPSSIEEQQKIASFLTAVDEKLTSLKKKKELLEQYKKGVMQKIFSQEIRFKNENGKEFPKWNYKHGNEIFDSISDKNHNSDLPILAITQEHGAIPRELIDYNISVTEASVESYKVVQKGDFIISLRSFQGGIEYSEYKGICSPAYIILRSKITIDDRFFKSYLKTESYIKELNKKLEGIRDGKMISYKYFSEVKLPYPCLEEQTKIANFLSAIDKKIDQCQLQIEQTTQWKKGLLQKMFV